MASVARNVPAGLASAASSVADQAVSAVEVAAAINIVKLSRIIMISWKLLAVFHDPIHDFGLNIDRMCSIVKYINDIQTLINNFQTDSTPDTNADVKQFTGGSKKKYETSDIHTLYLEEQNIGSISTESSHGEEADSDESSAVTTDMIALYKSGLHQKYLEQRAFYTSITGNTLRKYETITPEQNKSKVYQLQLYNQFFTNITKLIDLLKVLIVIQVVEKHASLKRPFDYNNVHKQTILSAIEDLQIALAEVDDDHDVELSKQRYDLEIRTLGYLLTVISILFDTMSSRHCYLQLDLLNSSTFNNLVRIYFSCYFNDNDSFFNTLDEWSKEHLSPLPITAHQQFVQNRSDMSDLIKKGQDQRLAIIRDKREDFFIDQEASILFSQVSGQENLEEDPDGFEYTELEYEVEREFGGGRKKRHDSKHPFILKGGGLSGKAKKWSDSSRSTDIVKAAAAERFLQLVKNDWSETYQSGSKWNDKSEEADYKEAIDIFNILTGPAAALLRENFPILFTKITKDIEYHKKKVDEVGARSGRTSPKSMVITKIRNYMNEIVSEVKALEAEIDNQEKRDNKNQQASDVTEVNTNITNPVSKLFAKKGLDYAKQALDLYLVMNPDGDVAKNIKICIAYIDEIYKLKAAANKPSAMGGGGNKSPQRGGAAPTDPSAIDVNNNIEFEILLHHLNFLGVVYLSDKKCLPDIDGKLIRYWTTLCSREKYSSYVIDQDELNGYAQKQFNKSVRVINNGIPADLKAIFHDKVWCPSSSVCDSMGNFGSCAGTKRKTEFHSMSIHITDEDELDYYDVYSKIDKSTILEVVSNSFNLDFGRGDTMVIDAKYGNVNLNIKPEMLSANNVFKQTLTAIEICFRESGRMSVGDLWASLESTDKFKRIITPTCWKATGDINQEFNSIVANGGYANIPENQSIRDSIMNALTTLGLAGDRPSGVRMILLALFSLNEGSLIRNFVVGYANPSSGLYVRRTAADAAASSGTRGKVAAAAAAPGGKAAGRGGRIRKTKFRKPKIIKTRKNKSHHYKMMSKRRKYNNNKTKNRKQ